MTNNRNRNHKNDLIKFGEHEEKADALAQQIAELAYELECSPNDLLESIRDDVVYYLKELNEASEG